MDIPSTYEKQVLANCLSHNTIQNYFRKNYIFFYLSENIYEKESLKFC